MKLDLHRSDFREVGDGSEVDFFADICIRLGIANNNEEAADIESIEVDAELLQTQRY